MHLLAFRADPLLEVLVLNDLLEIQFAEVVGLRNLVLHLNLLARDLFLYLCSCLLDLGILISDNTLKPIYCFIRFPQSFLGFKQLDLGLLQLVFELRSVVLDCAFQPVHVCLHLFFFRLLRCLLLVSSPQACFRDGEVELLHCVD